MVGWHHRLDGYGFGWTLGVGDGQGGLACCSLWGHKELDTIKQLNNNIMLLVLFFFFFPHSLILISLILSHIYLYNMRLFNLFFSFFTVSVGIISSVSSIQLLLCPTLCDPINCSTPGLPVHHQLPESTQTHIH